MLHCRLGVGRILLSSASQGIYRRSPQRYCKGQGGRRHIGQVHELCQRHVHSHEHRSRNREFRYSERAIPSARKG